MPYEINFTDPAANPTPITVNDQTLNTETDLTFVGKNYPGYSQFIGENFLHLLENFASNSAPSNPVAGQLWYKTGIDTSPAQPKLMIYDGTRWTEASAVKKGTTQPAAEISVAGDLWVDTANQQLYLYTGAVWVLVGPSFNQGSLTGVKAEEIIDRDTNTGKYVLIFYVADSPVIIVSKYDFVPKVTIAGFPRIREGVNLTKLNFTTFDSATGEFVNKLWGTAEKSNALVVGTTTVPAANFLRSDTTSTSNFPINIRNGGGLSVGESLETSLTTSSAGAILNHKTPGSPIILQTTDSGGGTKSVVTVTSNERIGINNGNPNEALDVNGNILTNGVIKTTNTTTSTSIVTGSLVTAGGAGIAGSLNVGNNADISGHLTVGSASPGVAISPRSNENYDIGSVGTRFRHVYSQNFTGSTFTGSFVGGLTGNVTGSATSLSNTAQFSLTGDVVSNVIPFNGSNPVPVRNIAFAARASQGTGEPRLVTITTSVNHNYVSGYIVSVICSNTSFNASAIIKVTGLTTFTYEQDSALPIVAPGTPATGTVTVSPGGSFQTSISEELIVTKDSVATPSDSDNFLIYRTGQGLKKISKGALFATAGTVPVGSIFPYAGDTPPVGYLLCDGSEQSITFYSDLYAVLGSKYGVGIYDPVTNPTGLRGFQTFRLPDLRGRFALGKEDMDNGNTVNLEVTATGATRNAITALGAITATFVVSTSLTTNGPFQLGKILTSGTGSGPGGLDVDGQAAVITSIVTDSPSPGFSTITVSIKPQGTTYPAASGLTLKSLGTTDGGGGTPSPSRVSGATTLGYSGGSATRTLSVNQLPQHTHDLRGSAGNQYYAIRFAAGVPTDAGAIQTNIHNTSTSSHLLPSSGNVNSGSIGQPIDILNPYSTINYIIFTGKVS